MTDRPRIFTLDPHHHLAQGLVFAGLGAHAGSDKFVDSSLYAHDGTLNNMEPSDWGNRIGRPSLTFGGTDEYVSSSNLARTMELATQATFAAWMYRHSDNQILTAGFLDSGGSNKRAGILHYSDRHVYFIVDTGTGSSSTPYLEYAGITGWFHFALVFNGGLTGWDRVSAFVDGEEQSLTTGGSQPGAALEDAADLGTGISGRYGTTYASSNSAVQDLCMWTRALTPSEISQLADSSNVMLSGLIQPPTRKWWPVSSGAAPATGGISKVIGGGICV